MIHITGTEYAYLITLRDYRDYILSAEFKWGTATQAPRAGKARDSGILFHVHESSRDKVFSSEGNPNAIWPKSLEFQMIEGGTGDIFLLGGARLRFTCESTVPGRIHRIGKGPWKDAVDYRDPSGEIEKPCGDWNRVLLIADGGRITYYLNGRLVNDGLDADPAFGKIILQSEGAEVFFRKLLRPLKK